jgi:hypothetical protein
LIAARRCTCNAPVKPPQTLRVSKQELPAWTARAAMKRPHNMSYCMS